MSKMNENINISPLRRIGVQDLKYGDRIRIVMFNYYGSSVKYGRYTGRGLIGTDLEINDVHLYDNGYWLWDGKQWIDVNDCYVIKESSAEDEIPFTDFSNVLEAEVEASECL